MLGKVKPLFIGGSKRNLTVTALMLIGLSLASVFLIGFVETRELLIYNEGVVTQVKTQKNLVGDVLIDEGITLNEFDEINCDINTKVSDVNEVRIDRAVLVYLNCDGQRKEFNTAKNTVKDFVDSIGVSLSQYDEINPVLEDSIYDGMEITINRVTVDNLVTEDNTPFEVEVINNPNQYDTYERIVQVGQNGVIRKNRRIVKRDGNIIKDEMVSEDVVSEPVKKIVEIGTKPKPKKVSNSGLSSYGFNLGQKEKNPDFGYSKVITCNATAYDASVASNGVYAGKTATGMKMQYGIVAVDPRVIPLGSKLYIESSDDGKSWVYGYAIAGDTGGAIKGNKIDLFFYTRSETINFGRKVAKVYVLN